MRKIKNHYTYIFRNYPDVVNIHQMCEMLGGISTKTGYALLKSKQIKSIKAGRSYLIPKIHILTYLKIIDDTQNQQTCVK